jgi:hypothetical protein
VESAAADPSDASVASPHGNPPENTTIWGTIIPTHEPQHQHEIQVLLVYVLQLSLACIIGI